MDAGVNLSFGESQCGIIIAQDDTSVEIKMKLLKIDPSRATTAETLSVAEVLNRSILK